MKSFEDAVYVSVEKDYTKKRTKHLMTNIDKGKVTLIVNKDCLKEALETRERFGTYKEKSLQVHSELNRLIIAKKVRKEVEAFVEQARFTKEAIAKARAKHAAQHAGTSSAPTGTPTSVKTSWKRKGKIVEPHAAPVKIGKRKKQQAHKPVDTDEEVTESEGEKKALRASGKRSKGVGTSTVKYLRKLVTKLTPLENLMMNIKEYGLLTATKVELDEILSKAKASFGLKKRLTRILIGETQSVHEETKQILKKVLGLILDEEEEVKEVELGKFEAEDLFDGFKITDFKLDDQPGNTQTELEIIHDDDDTGNNDDADATDNVNVQDVDTQMFEQHEQEHGQREKKNEEENKDEEPPIATQTIDTHPPLV
ncbi:uncharacterized protein LOC131857713 [Cryptomeria japonica]|uniref:uncharacterized protein LOC131857713 n=1 Tax=Cryptomeria japonica TaxID=3369 RepID=UPI0027DA9624|nr:uncharacterized protein LOC131857713 [Cryptomeria japonica]